MNKRVIIIIITAYNDGDGGNDAMTAMMVMAVMEGMITITVGLHTIDCTMYTIQCTLYIVHVLYKTTVQCTLYIVQCTLYNTQHDIV